MVAERLMYGNIAAILDENLNKISVDTLIRNFTHNHKIMKIEFFLVLIGCQRSKFDDTFSDKLSIYRRKQ